MAHHLAGFVLVTTNRPLGQVAGLRAVSLPPETARAFFHPQLAGTFGSRSSAAATASAGYSKSSSDPLRYFS